MSETIIDVATHRKLAVQFFNLVWSLLDKPMLTAEEEEEMIHATHASRYHWGVVGTDKERSIGEWQISRVYADLNRAEPAIHHAPRDELRGAERDDYTPAAATNGGSAAEVVPRTYSWSSNTASASSWPFHTIDA